MPLRDLLQSLKEAGLTAVEATPEFARGVGKGATFGAIQYPAALALKAAAHLDGQPLSYQDALKSVQESLAERERESPLASAAGQIVGSMAFPAVGYAAPARTLLGTLGKTAGYGALSGAASGFTAQPGMENVGQDVTLGALTGGALGTLGGAGAYGASKIMRNRGLNAINEDKAEAAEFFKNANPIDVLKVKGAYKDLFTSKKVDDALSALLEMRKIKNPSNDLRNYYRHGITGELMMNRNADLPYNVSNIANLKDIVETHAGSLMLPSTKRIFESGSTKEVKTVLKPLFRQEVKQKTGEVGKTFLTEAIPGMGLGAGGGYLASGIAPESFEVDPLSLALLGAGIGGFGGTKQLAGQLGSAATRFAAAKLPAQTYEGLGRAATNFALKEGLAPVEKPVDQQFTPERLKELDDIFDSYEETPAARATAPAAPAAPAKPSKFNYANEYGVPEDLLKGVHRTESGFGAKMKSKAGAEGHFQFMPKTAQEYGLKDPYDFEQSKSAAARKLADLHKEYGNWDDALRAYNLGQGNLKKVVEGKKAMPAETAEYVGKVRGITPERLKELDDIFDSY